MKVPALIMVVVVIAALWYWQRTSAEALTRLYVTEVTRTADVIVIVTATGTVEPTNQVEISSELSGTILAVDVSDNDLVKQGQILAQLDTDKLEATVEHSRASLASKKARVKEAEATLEETRKSYERASTLLKQGITTPEQFQSSQAAFERAQASVSFAESDVRVAEADLRLNETNLAKACICSPIEGIVLDRNVEVGQIVASSLQAPVLFTLADDLKKMELRVAVDEADIGRVAVGNTATFTVEAYQDRVFPATISALRYLPETINGVVTYQAVLSIENEELLLRPGMTATADVIVAQVKNALVVPNAALRFTPPMNEQDTPAGGSGLVGMLFKNRPSSDSSSNQSTDKNGRKIVWVLQNDEAVPVEVRTGSTDGSITEIVEGEITLGSPVITDLVTQ